MSAIGGYFGLEICRGQAYHDNLIAINSGRNAFEYILRAKHYKHVYIPYFSCDVILEPLQKLQLNYTFYSINERLEVDSFVSFDLSSAVLYINYFGLKGDYIKSLTKKIPHLIIDSSQAFYSRPFASVSTFYSPRKFFGVPDGGYVSCSNTLMQDLPEDSSSERFSHLLVRLDKSAEEGYSSFLSNESSLSRQPLSKMSKLTVALLNGIDYDWCLKKRNENFYFLHRNLGSKNGLVCLTESDINGPLVYPFLSAQTALRERLIMNKVYVARYWPNVYDWVNKDSTEYIFCSNLLPLPIDHRYGEREMRFIVDIISG